MPRLRLFGPLVDAAQTRSDTVPGTSVDQVLEAARRRYGHEFAELAGTSQVWVNGETPEPGTRLTDDDEVALLPPVSGG